ncbi:MAG TPA: hypothetical protein VJR92_01335 [Gemmatimonadaceae bacterium]|nr:hypothetical protein [Gemmatimonadaceae bacterium]
MRRGFALITVLWVIVMASAIAAAGAVAGTDAGAAKRNRINATRAHWQANACVDRARFAIDRALAETAADARDSAWRAIDAALAAMLRGTAMNCSMRIIAAGTQLNVNTASEADLLRALTSAGAASPLALTHALLDWIDSDDNPRELGAERTWYTSAQRRQPRNAPLTSVSELRFIRGFETDAFDTILGVDSARISLATAPAPVLASLPGFTDEAVARVLEWRIIGRQVDDLVRFASTLSASAASTLVASFPELARSAALEPEWWTVSATAAAGTPAVSSTVEIRLVRAQSRTASLGRRVW